MRDEEATHARALTDENDGRRALRREVERLCLSICVSMTGGGI